MDLSAPEGPSVNNFLDKNLGSRAYLSVDDVADTVRLLSKGPSPPGKTEVKEAFRIIPVDPTNRLLLTMQWTGQLLLGKVGLCSAPPPPIHRSGRCHGVDNNKGVEHIFHYIDNSILAGPRHSTMLLNHDLDPTDIR